MATNKLGAVCQLSWAGKSKLTKLATTSQLILVLEQKLLFH